MKFQRRKQRLDWRSSQCYRHKLEQGRESIKELRNHLYKLLINRYSNVWGQMQIEIFLFPQ